VYSHASRPSYPLHRYRYLLLCRMSAVIVWSSRAITARSLAIDKISRVNWWSAKYLLWSILDSLNTQSKPLKIARRISTHRVPFLTYIQQLSLKANNVLYAEVYHTIVKKVILLTFWRNKWSGIGCTPANVMHIIWVEADPEVMGCIIFVAFVAKANSVACYMAVHNATAMTHQLLLGRATRY